MMSPPSLTREQVIGPPERFVNTAIELAMCSPCRSKRGVVIFRENLRIASGYNERRAEQMHDVLLTVKEYAELFKVTDRSVYLAIKEQRLPYPIERPLGRSPRILVPVELVSRLRAA